MRLRMTVMAMTAAGLVLACGDESGGGDGTSYEQAIGSCQSICERANACAPMWGGSPTARDCAAVCAWTVPPDPRADLVEELGRCARCMAQHQCDEIYYDGPSPSDGVCAYACEGGAECDAECAW